MAKLNNFEKRLKNIEDRNRRVEIDKTWETSFTRRGLLTLFTYLAIGFYLQAAKIEKPWLNAIVPSAAFMPSTLTMPFFKKIWVKCIK